MIIIHNESILARSVSKNVSTIRHLYTPNVGSPTSFTNILFNKFPSLLILFILVLISSNYCCFSTLDIMKFTTSYSHYSFHLFTILTLTAFKKSTVLSYLISVAVANCITSGLAVRTKLHLSCILYKISYPSPGLFIFSYLL